MTVSITTTRVQYDGDGVTTTFTYPFLIYEDTDLVVIHTDSANDETVMVLNTDYTVTGAGTSTGGTVVLDDAADCATGETLTILRNMDFLQETDFVDGNAFSSESFEDALDKHTLELQQLSEAVLRAAKLPRSSGITDLELPFPEENKYLGWNATATNLTNYSNTPSATSLGATNIVYLSNYATFATAVSTIGATETTLILDTGGTVLTSVTTPVTLEIVGTQMGGLTIATEQTLMINGHFSAGNYQIFNCLGTGAVSFATGSCSAYSPLWFGCAGDSTTNDSTNFQKFLNSVPAGGEIVIPEKTFKVLGLYAWQNELVWDCKGWLEPYNNDATATVLTIGLNSSSQTTATRRWRGNINVGDVDGDYASWDNITGIKFEYLSDSKLTLNGVGMGLGLDLSPDFATGGGASNGYVTYNEFHLGLMGNNKVAVNIDPKDASSAVNENTFYGGRFTLDTGTYTVGCKYINITNGNGNKPNNNVFYRPSFEGASQIFNCASRYNHIIDARVEVTDSTDHTPAYVAGTDYAEPYLYFASTSIGNTFQTSHDSGWDSYWQKDLGAATRVSDGQFTIATNLTSWFWPGAPIKVTVGGAVYYVHVLASSYSSPNTTVSVSAPVITDNPTAVNVPSVQQVSGATLNTIGMHGYNVKGAQVIQTSMHRQRIMYARSALSISGLSSNYPAISLSPSSSASDTAFSIRSFSAENFSVNYDGQLKMLRYNYQTLADDATPSVKGYSFFTTGGTTTITDFDDGVEGQVIIILSAHAITITDGTNIFLNGSANFVMAATDTLTLVCGSDNKWYETGRADNT